MMSIHKKSLLSLIIFMVIVLISSITYLEFGLYVNTGVLHIKNIAVSNQNLQVLGTTTNSGEAFAGYNYTMENSNLYLKLRYSVVNPIHRSGDFNITIKENVKNIKNAYLQGSKPEDKKLIWTN